MNDPVVRWNGFAVSAYAALAIFLSSMALVLVGSLGLSSWIVITATIFVALLGMVTMMLSLRDHPIRVRFRNGVVSFEYGLFIRRRRPVNLVASQVSRLRASPAWFFTHVEIVTRAAEHKWVFSPRLAALIRTALDANGWGKGGEQARQRDL